MRHYFLCTIGPVQDFIATARRSRDLWYGSWMLSELSKAAARAIAEDPQNTLVFPAPPSKDNLAPGSRFVVPNKVSAVIEGEPKQLAGKIESAIETRLFDMFEQSVQKIKDKIDYALAKRQVEDMLEFYWVSVRLENENDYASAREKAEMLLTARKTTRNFAPFAGKDVPKSALDGGRESVIPERMYPAPGASQKEKEETIRRLFSFYRARQGERLSGVDLMKRLGGEDQARHFRSTPDMAALPFFDRIEDEQGPQKRQELLHQLKRLVPNHDEFGVTEGLIFENRLPDDPNAEQIREQIAGLLKNFKHAPSPYYAILLADGDNMGAIIDSQKTIDAHRSLSQTLSRFAAAAEAIIEKHKGCSVYTGGDDVLAYLPMHTVLNCADELQREFANLLKGYEGYKDGKPVSPTLSVGIAINHHIESLSEALELARSAEREAKKVHGKNGLAILVSKRSGADRTIQGQFPALLPRLNALLNHAYRRQISAGTAYELHELHRTLSGLGLGDGMNKEALRIIERKREGGSNQKVSPEVIKQYEEWLQSGISLEQLATEMIIAQMFAEYRWEKGKTA